MLESKEYIYAVYQEKSFSKAARKLYVSQPWLSAKVKKVEQQLGLSLFDRSTSPISLTRAGEIYVEEVERIMDIEAELEQRFRQLRETQKTQLRIGSSMFFCTYVLPSLLSDFREMYPQVALSFLEGTSPWLLEHMLDGKLDFVLEVEKPTDSAISCIPWASEEIILAVPASFEINQRLKPYSYTFEQFLERNRPEHRHPPVPLQEFRNESFLILNRKHDIHTRSMKMCKNAGFIPNVAMHLSQMMTGYYLVCEGRGITFLRSTIPQYVAPTQSVVFYQLDDPQARRSIYLSWPRRPDNPILDAFLAFMKENASLEREHPAL